MRVLQLIDSLHPGGAERMAVTYANTLSINIDKSFLCCTREEGSLKSTLSSNVCYIFLNKSNSVDIYAFLKLRKYIVKNQIDIIHAHSTSFFLACLLKISGVAFKLVWHDHYGNSEFLEEREFKVLRYFSKYFDGIISVNTILKNWATVNLKCLNIIELRNFCEMQLNNKGRNSFLKGNQEDYKIICVANLRPQKDHITLLKAFEKLIRKYNVTLHLIGQDPKTEYSKKVLTYIANSNVSKSIFYYGIQSEIIELNRQADLGVLSSVSEGLPVSLLEYGLAGIPVVCTNVGQCKEVIKENGRLVIAGSWHSLVREIDFYFKNPKKRNKDAKNFQKHIMLNYSEVSLNIMISNFYNKILKK
tara:strand:+ start:8404 stop:9483 length:1080 start_codon:yes stop_codon:yes gene_type:complete